MVVENKINEESFENLGRFIEEYSGLSESKKARLRKLVDGWGKEHSKKIRSFSDPPAQEGEKRHTDKRLPQRGYYHK